MHGSIFMSFLHGLFKQKSSSSAPDLFSRSGQVCIVDATGMVNQRHKSGEGQGSPRDNAMVLKELAEFAARESLEMKAVFTGRELREAAEGCRHDGVFAYYGETREDVKKKITRLVKQAGRGRNVVVLTADPLIEAEASGLRAECMRLSTLKKAMESREEKQRPQQRRQDFQREPARDPEPEKKPPVADSRSAAVYNLIDPI